MGDQGPDFISFSVDQVDRSSLGANLGFGHFQNFPKKFRQVQGGAQRFTGLHKKIGFSEVLLNFGECLSLMQRDGGEAGVESEESQIGFRGRLTAGQGEYPEKLSSFQQGICRGELQTAFASPSEEGILCEGRLA